MKRFFKVCGITALALAVVGVILLGIGTTTVGTKEIGDMANKLSHGVVSLDFENGFNFDIANLDMGDLLKENAIYHIEDVDTFDKAYDIWKGDVEKTLLAEGNIREWELNLGGCGFELKDSGNASYYVEYKGKGKSQAYVEGNELHVKVLNSGDWSVNDTSNCLTLYVPMNVIVEEIEVNLGAGQMNLDELKAKELVISLGAGQIVAKKLQAESLSVSVGAGEIILTEAKLREVSAAVGAGNCKINGEIMGNVEAECAMGNMTLELAGKEQDFNYDIQCVTGNITVGDTEYSGLAQEKSINNNAAKTIEVECAMGNVEITFK